MALIFNQCWSILQVILSNESLHHFNSLTIWSTVSDPSSGHCIGSRCWSHRGWFVNMSIPFIAVPVQNDLTSTSMWPSPVQDALEIHKNTVAAQVLKPSMKSTLPLYKPMKYYPPATDIRQGVWTSMIHPTSWCQTNWIDYDSQF